MIRCVRPTAGRKRAAVPDQVELDVAPAPVGWNSRSRSPYSHVAAALDDRQVGVEEGVADRARHGRAALEAELGEVVEEDAADAALLVAVPFRKK